MVLMSCLNLVAIENPIIIDDIITTDETCELQNGSLTVLVSNPTPDLEYSADNGRTFQSSNFFENLASGDYIIIVTDGTCRFTNSIQIVDAPAPQVEIDFSCRDDVNRVDIELTALPGGIRPFSYVWAGPSGTFTDEDLSNVLPGEYTVVITDRIGCSIDTTLMIDDCCSLLVDCPIIDTTEIKCNNDLIQIDQLFLDNTSVGDEDLEAITRMGFNVGGQCADITVTAADELLGNQDCDNGPMVINRVFEISDGTSITSCHNVILVENFGDVEIIDNPQAMNINCSDDISKSVQDWIDNKAGATVRTCSGDYTVETIPTSSEIIFSCTGTGSLTVEFIITDECANEIRFSSQFSVSDTEAPSIECPEPIELMADDVDFDLRINAWLSDYTAEDNCSTATVTNNYDLNNLINECTEEELVVEFISVDDCDNQSSCETIVTLRQLFEPRVECPDALILQCDEEDMETIIDQWLRSARGFGFNNEVIDLDNDYNEAQLSSLTCESSITVNFDLNRVCIQANPCESSISIIDEIGPSIICPESITLDVSDIDRAMIIADFLGSAIATDNCTSAAIIHDWNMTEFNVDCSEDIDVKFTATDDCGNASDCSAVVSLLGGSELEILCREDEFVSYCDAANLEEDILGYLNSFEVNSSSPSFEISHDFDRTLLVTDCEDEYFIDVELFATDDCNNESTCSTLLQLLPPPNVYIPNIFNPEGGGTDSHFTVFSNSSVVEVEFTRIFDRWGSIIYEEENFPTNDSDYGWDGTFKGFVEKSNVVTYHIRIIGILGDSEEHTGTIQVLK
jgi:hypothetical protein